MVSKVNQRIAVPIDPQGRLTIPQQIRDYLDIPTDSDDGVWIEIMIHDEPQLELSLQVDDRGRVMIPASTRRVIGLDTSNGEIVELTVRGLDSAKHP